MLIIIDRNDRKLILLLSEPGIGHMVLRLSMYMKVCCDWSFVVARPMKRLYNLVRRMFGRPHAMRRSSFGL